MTGRHCLLHPGIAFLIHLAGSCAMHTASTSSMVLFHFASKLRSCVKGKAALASGTDLPSAETKEFQASGIQAALLTYIEVLTFPLGGDMLLGIGLSLGMLRTRACKYSMAEAISQAVFSTRSMSGVPSNMLPLCLNQPSSIAACVAITSLLLDVSYCRANLRKRCRVNVLTLPPAQPCLEP